MGWFKGDIHIKRCSVHWLRALVRTAGTLGVQRAELFAHAQLSPSLLNATDKFIDLRYAGQIWRSAQTLSGTAHFGLHMGHHIRPTAFSVVSFAVMNCETLGDALRSMHRYQSLVSEGGTTSFSTFGKQTKISYTPLKLNAHSRHEVEAMAALLIGFARWLTCDSLVPTQLCFAHKAPSCIADHQAIFRCPISFEAEGNFAIIDNRWFDHPLPEADSQLLRLHQDAAEKLLRQMQKHTFTQRTLAVLESSNHCNWTRSSLAKELAMSPRTLQRRLRANGTNFQEFFDQFRSRKAQMLVDDLTLSLSEIAPRLGFAEVSAFYRAFKRWKGITPGEFRNRLVN